MLGHLCQELVRPVVPGFGLRARCYHAPLMFSPMQISESAHGLVLSYPLSTGVTFLAAAVALVGYGLLGRRLIRRRWPIVLATAVAIWAASYFITFRVMLDDKAGSVYAFWGGDRSIRWQDATDIYLEHRGGATDWYVVVLDTQRRPFDFEVGDLSVEDRHRILAWMVDRMPPGASSDKPALLQRHAPYGPRRASLFSDQQI